MYLSDGCRHWVCCCSLAEQQPRGKGVLRSAARAVGNLPLPFPKGTSRGMGQQRVGGALCQPASLRAPSCWAGKLQTCSTFLGCMGLKGKTNPRDRSCIKSSSNPTVWSSSGPKNLCSLKPHADGGCCTSLYTIGSALGDGEGVSETEKKKSYSLQFLLCLLLLFFYYIYMHVFIHNFGLRHRSLSSFRLCFLRCCLTIEACFCCLLACLGRNVLPREKRLCYFINSP